MQVEWLGHSSFRLTDQTGVKIVTDPFDAAQVGISYPDVACDFVTVSHRHFDHDCVKNFKSSPKVIEGSGEFDCNGIKVNGKECYHDDKQGTLRGMNTVYKYIMDGVRLCHMGDIGEELSDAMAQFIGHVDVLMIPVGGTFTIDAAQAKHFVDILKPSVVIPMHYRIDGYTMNITDLNNFLRFFKSAQIEYAKTTVLTFDGSDFDGQNTRIIVPNRIG